MNNTAILPSFRSFQRHPPQSVLGHSLHVWRTLQDEGQRTITRFKKFAARYHRLRRQDGFDHLASVTFLCNEILLQLRPFVTLEELLVTWAFQFHDVSEGIRRIDVAAPVKKQEDDLAEYLVFRELFEPLGEAVWKEIEKAFLLQFALTETSLFPNDAKAVIRELRETRRMEALAFLGIQNKDYLYFAEDCADDGVTSAVLEEVGGNTILDLDKIAEELPGFREVVWTPERREYFRKYSFLP